MKTQGTLRRDCSDPSTAAASESWWIDPTLSPVGFTAKVEQEQLPRMQKSSFGKWTRSFNTDELSPK